MGAEKLAGQIAQQMEGRRRTLGVSVQNLSPGKCWELLLAVQRLGFRVEVEQAIVGQKTTDGVTKFEAEPCLVVHPKRRKAGREL